MTILQLIEQIIGTTYYTTEISPDGFPIVVYSVPYVVASLMILMSLKAIYTWITIVVKRCNRVGGGE